MTTDRQPDDQIGDRTGEPPPRVWVLLGHRSGDNGQAVALAAALGWPFERKQLRYTALHHAPNWLLGAGTAHLARDADPIAPPWPDLVIGVGKRSVPVARWIRRRSGGRTRLVQIGRPFAPLHDFDLLVTTPQYGLPARANVRANLLPLNRPDPSAMAQAADVWAPRLAHLPRPWTAVLVGGRSAPYSLDARAGNALAAFAAAHLAGDPARADGSLLVTTSPRTPADATDALAAALGGPHFLNRWKAGAENPYPAFLALADDFIVTADSASMLAEAGSTGRPVAVFEAGPRNLAPRTPGPIWRWIAERGIATPPRDMARLQAAVRAAGGAAAGSRDDLARTVARVKALLLRPGLDYIRAALPDSAAKEAVE